ncbi:hypothetical protein, partial [Haliscomenobacter sp.]|uniref:hypothetical protein n=1 Tax=Haliscomenobacter sp. TaxID=2717303 RepID=UPI003364FC39
FALLWTFLGRSGFWGCREAIDRVFIGQVLLGLVKTPQQKGVQHFQRHTPSYLSFCSYAFLI